MSSAARTGADASRPPSSGLITPTSDGRSQAQSDLLPSSGGTKRKLDGSIVMDHLLKPSITVKPHPPNLHAHPIALQPLMLLSREHLSLAALDLTNPSGALAPSRVYESHVKILEFESRIGTSDSILIARHESKKVLYAVERQDNGLHTVCKLGSWVDARDLATKATVVNEERLHMADQMKQQAPVLNQTPSPHLFKESKQKNAAIQAIQTLVRKRSYSESAPPAPRSTTNQTDSQPRTLTDKAEAATKAHVPDSLNEKCAQSTPASVREGPSIVSPEHGTTEGILDSIRSQYLDALYKSKGSLAYFAKGPLSRARSKFQLDLESNLEVGDLIDFLKTLVLTTVQVDKKYRESIPDLVIKFGSILESSDEGKKKKPRSKKIKMKIGKDALYPTESELIQSWWSMNKPELKDEEHGYSPTHIRPLASSLRTRETQLQMILILEILALEPLRVTEEEQVLPTLPGGSDNQQQMAPPPPKKKNKHNLPVLVDVHADRLTIWQSTNFDVIQADDSQQQSEPSQMESQQPSSEPLKDFCMDVIVPFFSSRLPDLCGSLNAKLGGPVIVSTSKSKSSKKTSGKPGQKPGAVTKKLVTAKPRTLQRALSTDFSHRRSLSRGPTNAIALMRSATTTSMPTIKREESEPPLRHDDDPANPRPGLSLSRSSSMVQLADGRASKKAKVEAELKDAISMLRKPNRQMVGREIVDAATRRTSDISSRKAKKPARHSLDSSIQVMATPANNRFRNVLPTSQPALADIPLASTEEVIPPSSVGTLIPSTAQRATTSNRGVLGTSPADTVGITPIRPSSKANFLKRVANNDSAILQSSPLMERTNTNSIKAVTKLDFHARDRVGVIETPLRKAPVKLVFELDNEKEQEQELQPPRKASIYEKLGWDDEFDDLD